MADGSESFLAGSSVDGQASARHLAQELKQNIDFMVVVGSVTNESCLVASDVPGFLQVVFDKVNVKQCTGGTELPIKLNSYGQMCVDGFKMKQQCCGPTDTYSFFPTSSVTINSKTATNAANVYYQVELNPSEQQPSGLFAIQFAEALNLARSQRAQGNFHLLKEKYIQVCNNFRQIMSQILPLFGSTTGNIRTDIQGLIGLTGPAYEIDIPQVKKARLYALLEFYHKWKSIENPNIIYSCI
ncbi:unnamed protein product [Didymodactylos carnosus]|uniref:Uncharacterized protein n=1 Tax=Didymodactylos carnosus TaxID=1234261 RepID=A0A8S2FXH1_9BILA|nr:unnamed protein product [Didymodactylos carnosus]CAF4383993.1 unnamed protein product [Didymodactylos carnosus]